MQIRRWAFAAAAVAVAVTLLGAGAANAVADTTDEIVSIDQVKGLVPVRLPETDALVGHWQNSAGDKELVVTTAGLVLNSRNPAACLVNISFGFVYQVGVPGSYSAVRAVVEPGTCRPSQFARTTLTVLPGGLRIGNDAALWTRVSAPVVTGSGANGSGAPTSPSPVDPDRCFGNTNNPRSRSTGGFVPGNPFYSVDRQAAGYRDCDPNLVRAEVGTLETGPLTLRVWLATANGTEIGGTRREQAFNSAYPVQLDSGATLTGEPVQACGQFNDLPARCTDAG